MTTDPALASRDAHALEREAAASLADALAMVNAPRVAGVRERHRDALERAIALADAVLVATDEPRTVTRARKTSLAAHVARAEDARHGAAQLSLGAQRAPTRDACDDGWLRVEDVVAVAECSARAAAELARVLGTEGAARRARRADASAREARRIVDERNYAYTFHADPGFSFGEGWYVVAAAVLAGVPVQLEPGQPQGAHALRFLRDAGVVGQLRPHRPRPRANKQLTEIVAKAFRADPHGAQRTLRAAFLGDAPIAADVAAWADEALAAVAPGRKVLLWVREGSHQPFRNTTYPELVELARRVRAVGLIPVLVGDALRSGEVPAGVVDLTRFFTQPCFQGDDTRRAQLQFFEHLVSEHGLVGQLGVTTAGMDGPALMGLPTMYLTDAPNVRMRAWVGEVPGYVEVVRDDDAPALLDATLRGWADRR